MENNKFIEHRDYILDSKTGRVILTSSFHYKRGQCCANGCLMCPYTKPVKKGNIQLDENFKYLKNERQNTI